MKFISHFVVFTIATIFSFSEAQAQIGLKTKKNEKQKVLSPDSEYTIGGIVVSGSKYLDEELLISISGLSPGDKIKLPSDPKITKANQPYRVGLLLRPWSAPTAAPPPRSPS